jgi:hypothetical protein
MSIAQTYWDLRATKLWPVIEPSRDGTAEDVTKLVEVPVFTNNNVLYFYNMEPRLIRHLGILAGGIHREDIETRGTRWLKRLYDNYVDFRGIPEGTDFPPLEQLWYTYSPVTQEYRMTTTYYDTPQTPYQYFFALTKWMKAAVDGLDLGYIVALTNRIAKHNRSIRDAFLTKPIRGTYHPDAIQKNLMRREMGPKWPGKAYGRPF